MITFTGRDLTNPHEWFNAQKFPLFISEDSQCTMWGRFIYFDQAFLPGISKNWGHKACISILRSAGKFNPRLAPGQRPTPKQRVQELLWLNINRLAYKAQDFDSWVYLKPSKDDARTMPFVWFVRSRPTLRDGLLFPREDTEEQHE